MNCQNLFFVVREFSEIGVVVVVSVFVHYEKRGSKLAGHDQIWLLYRPADCRRH